MSTTQDLPELLQRFLCHGEPFARLHIVQDVHGPETTRIQGLLRDPCVLRLDNVHPLHRVRIEGIVKGAPRVKCRLSHG